jgi:hypothetical protein
MNTPIALGHEHGRNAYLAGKELVPHFDANCQLYIETHEHEEIIKYLKAWYSGHIKACLLDNSGIDQ